MMHLLTWETIDGDEENIRIRLEQNANVVEYAILSHRWGNPEDEVSFEDMRNGCHEDKRGYKKLAGCCKQARKDGLHHVWIDTCCINKESSAELSEAITSMFGYYQRSKFCYAFLDDVLVESSTQENLDLSSFSRTAWFTRGWTLQELIAPPNLKFFDALWFFLGYKTNKAISSVIESVTGIDSIVLNIPATTQLVSIAKKMSWAARRTTTRVEDMAYSLMGIFGVYMSPLYGEGHYAFIRLQEAIMRSSNDHTIFAWTTPPVAYLAHGFEHVSTMLALSPAQFVYSSNFKSLSHSEQSQSLTCGGHKLDFTITNAGLAICLPLIRINEVDGLYAAFLACTEGEDRIPSAIFLRTTAETPAGHFWRTNSNEGPIERSGRRWFPISGRQVIAPHDIYVLPRFSPVSGDNIEPLWSKATIRQSRPEYTENVPSTGKKDSFFMNKEVLDDLNQVLDPYFSQLAFLRQAHHMISMNQGDQLINLIRNKTRLRSSNILPQRNKFFCGRAAVLQQINDMFFLSGQNLERQFQGTKIRIITVSGVGGIGKTGIALEFCYNCLENQLFDTVIWISAQSTKTIRDAFRHVATELELTEQGSPADRAVREVLRWLSNFDRHRDIPSQSSAYSAKWLLVFDDANDASPLQSFLPAYGPGCVLVTSRSSLPLLGLYSEIIVLEPLTIQESSQMFKKMTKKEWEFTVMSVQLGGFPPAIAQIAGFIIKNELSLEEFGVLQEEFGGLQDELEMLPWSDLKPYDGKSVDTVWSSSFSQLNTLARIMLQAMSFLDPDYDLNPIIRRLQVVKSTWGSPNLLSILRSQQELLRLSLIIRTLKGDRHDMRVHRLVQDAVRKRMNRDEFREAWSIAVNLVYSSVTNGKNLLPHVVCLKYFATEMDSGGYFYTNREFIKLLACFPDQFGENETAVG
ncbi:hypothetical protein ACMFMG_003166 [Clarireedia jacksonii]